MEILDTMLGIKMGYLINMTKTAVILNKCMGTHKKSQKIGQVFDQKDRLKCMKNYKSVLVE